MLFHSFFHPTLVTTLSTNRPSPCQMNCKLYAWVSGWWQERGRGILRLNDWDAGGQQSGAEAAGGSGGSGKEIRSRLVIRTQGTLTVMLNTKVVLRGIVRGTFCPLNPFIAMREGHVQ